MRPPPGRATVNRKIVLLFSGILALLAVVLMQLYKANLKEELGVAGKRVPILAVREDISAFTVIERSMLMTKEYPQNYLPPRHLSKSLADDVIGQTTSYSVKKGDPLLTTDLASTQSEAKLSRVISEKMRALALPVDRVTSFGGLLRPNDHVDILGTFQKPGEGDVETVTLLQNVTVLAVGAQLGTGRGITDTGGGNARGGKVRIDTVTVLVTPEEAELLVFAQDRGELSITMRNEEDVNTEMELSGKNFADIFQPKTRARIQRKRDEGITILTPGGRRR